MIFLLKKKERSMSKAYVSLKKSVIAKITTHDLVNKTCFMSNCVKIEIDLYVINFTNQFLYPIQ